MSLAILGCVDSPRSAGPRPSLVPSCSSLIRDTDPHVQWAGGLDRTLTLVVHVMEEPYILRFFGSFRVDLFGLTLPANPTLLLWSPLPSQDTTL